jgi:hypothetical protein
VGAEGKFKVAGNSGIKVECSNVNDLLYGGSHFPTFRGFKITTNDGIIYHFGFSENLIETTATQLASMSVPPSYATSWLLYKIEIPDNNAEIKFNYNQKVIDATSSTVGLTVDNGGRCRINCDDPYSNDYYQTPFHTGENLFYSVIEHAYLESIEAPNFNIDFFTSKANDKGVSHNWEKLDEITITAKLGGMAKIFSFTYDTGNNTRLYLKKLQEYGKPAYEFQYKGNQSLNYNTKDRDHWGYYNGNSYLLTANRQRTPSIFTIQGDDTEYFSIDRETEPDSVTTGMLSKIKYPTGGTVEFEFEANDYSKYYYRLIPYVVKKAGLKNGLIRLENVRQ